MLIPAFSPTATLPRLTLMRKISLDQEEREAKNPVGRAIRAVPKPSQLSSPDGNGTPGQPTHQPAESSDLCL